MSNPDPESLRRSVIAGSWYPGSQKALAKAVDTYLSKVDQPPIGGELVGLISPHAGYDYSGQTAAHAYRQLAGRTFDTVVVMGPSHRAWVGDYAVNAEDAYETPLGTVPLDHDFIEDLAKDLPLRQVRRDVEHSLEIQLPFLQRQLPGFRLVPIIMSADDPAVAHGLAQSLVRVIQGRAGQGQQTLLVASSDLHHIENYDEVHHRDQPVVEAVDAYDLEALTARLMAPGSTVCGRMPILTAMVAGKGLGADQARVLQHTTSGDVTGQRQAGQYTVGYMAAAIYRSA
jgi:MEMO1 family protein